MHLSPRRITLGLAATALLGVALIGGTALTVGVVAAPSAGATTAPPWEPDPGSVGGLTFYNSSGDTITGGSIDTAPIAAYVEGGATVHAGNTKATLFAYTPVSGQLPTQWSGRALGLSTMYPNTDAPAPLNTSTLPVETGSATDLSLATYIAIYPNTNSTSNGYAGVYQLRLKTSEAGQPGNTTYDSADIAVSGSTWSVVYPATVPGAPTIGTATAGNGSASVTFTAPTSNGGSPITGYTVTSSPGGITATGTTSPITVTGLTNGTAYTFTVKATNAVGTGSASAASNSVTPVGLPGAPTIGTATAGNGSASVTFTAPASDGGSTITGYTVTSSPGGLTGTGTTSPITVTGLTNGDSYTFTVKATNAVGTGSASAASNSVTPEATLPGAPTIGTATAGNGSASVTFTAPATNGGSAITGYTVTSSPGGITATGSTSPIAVTGLTNGTVYTFTVTATNAIGTGSASAASNSVTPVGLPGAPTIGTATAGNAQASVTFAAPASNGGSTITGYTVTSAPGGITASGTTSPIAVTGLTNGDSYTFTVKATNAVGTGSASAASNSVTPATVPGAPTIGTATAGNAQASVTFTAPASNGGSADHRLHGDQRTGRPDRTPAPLARSASPASTTATPTPSRSRPPTPSAPGPPPRPLTR